MAKANSINELSIKIGKTDTDRELLVLQLREACKGMDRDEIKAAILPGWAQGAGIVLNEDGTWPGGSAGSAGAAKKRFNRLIADILDVGETSDKAAPTKVRISKAEREAALALLEACGSNMNRVRAVLKAVA